MIDPHSPTWRLVKALAEKDIASSQSRLEASGCDIATTENLRGQIKALRNILALAEPQPTIPSSDPLYI